ncbi:PREDICTED: SUN domain-containing protein 3-like [Vollenhovia emeryi]|uniref:SUN domain-containing protein 3-like n=1 Tax=Vollenhovia emeryi TaxID=411798 RepID=UPI0005F3DAEB|nr:PREDICTED: SUN domain-containing protein 3-like [Vollenhovia emeryi]
MCHRNDLFPGYLIIKLRSAIYLTGFTLGHIPRRILPNGDISSAPRKFKVWGLLSENDLEPVMFAMASTNSRRILTKVGNIFQFRTQRSRVHTNMQN